MTQTLQQQHESLKAQIKRRQAALMAIETVAIQEGLATKLPKLVVEFRWPQAEVLERWGVDVWETYKRERTEQRFTWK